MATFKTSMNSIVNIARGYVLDEDYLKGVLFLSESLSGITMDDCYKILDGSHMISDDGDLIQDERKQYIKKVNEIYSNYFYHQGKLCKAEGVIDTLPLDKVQLTFSRNETKFNQRKVYSLVPYLETYDRSKIYLHESKTKFGENVIISAKHIANILPRFINEIKRTESFKDFLDELYENNNFLNKEGYLNDYINLDDKFLSYALYNTYKLTYDAFKQSEKVEMELKKRAEKRGDIDFLSKHKKESFDKKSIQMKKELELLKSRNNNEVLNITIKNKSNEEFSNLEELERNRNINQIWNQNGLDNIIELEDDDTGEIYKIPRIPFVNWSIRDTVNRMRENYDIKEELKDYLNWEAVSKSGEKMLNDNPIHTDWVVASGINIESLYDYSKLDFNKKIDKLRMKIIDDYLGCPFAPLSSSNKETISGDAYKVEKDEYIDSKKIILVPNLSDKYYIPIMSAIEHGGAVITKNGGKMSHIVNIGREQNADIILYPDMNINKLNKKYVIIDYNEYKIRTPSSIDNNHLSLDNLMKM